MPGTQRINHVRLGDELYGSEVLLAAWRKRGSREADVVAKLLAARETAEDALFAVQVCLRAHARSDWALATIV